MEKELKIFRCECQGEAIGIEKSFFSTQMEDVGDIPEYNLSFWTLGSSYAKDLKFMDKLRLIRYIIKNGHPYTDMVILSKNTLIELRDHINKLLEEEK